MRDYDHRLMIDLVGVAQKLHNLPAVLTVKIPGRLVGKKERRRIEKRSSDGDPLLLTAGELIWQMSLSALKLKKHNQFFHSLLIDLSSIHQHRKHHVLPHIQNRDQIIELIDQTHLTSPKYRQLLLVLRIDIDSSYRHLPGCGPVYSAAHVQKRRFARTGRTDDRYEFSAVRCKRYVIQRMYRILSFPVYLAKVFDS